MKQKKHGKEKTSLFLKRCQSQKSLVQTVVIFIYSKKQAIAKSSSLQKSVLSFPVTQTEQCQRAAYREGWNPFLPWALHCHLGDEQFLGAMYRIMHAACYINISYICANHIVYIVYIYVISYILYYIITYYYHKLLVQTVQKLAKVLIYDMSQSDIV